jgi:hypothetical protein
LTAKFPGFLRDHLFSGSAERHPLVSRHAVPPGILGEVDNVDVALFGVPSVVDPR